MPPRSANVEAHFAHSPSFKAYMIKTFPPKTHTSEYGRRKGKIYQLVFPVSYGRHFVRIEYEHIYLGSFTDYEFAASLAIFLKENKCRITSQKHDRNQSFMDCKMMVQNLYNEYLYKIRLIIFIFNSRRIYERGIIEFILKRSECM